MKSSSLCFTPRFPDISGCLRLVLAGTALGACLIAPLSAQQQPPQQQQWLASAPAPGVPMDQLSRGAPLHYTVKRGDTLWDIAGLYLQQSWLWPQLWGMNRDTVRNPHWIYPGQVLHLHIRDGRAMLGTPQEEPVTIRLSPAVRSQPMAREALPTVRRDLIEPFLVRPVVRDRDGLALLPDIVAAVDNRLVLGNGDLVYARGTNEVPLSVQDGTPRELTIFRQPRPLRDPASGEILGYEGEWVGQAQIQRDEFFQEITGSRGQALEEYRPATLLITRVASEVRIGDRLDVNSEGVDYTNFMPQLPPEDTTGLVVSIYSDQAVQSAASGQVVAINLGQDDGIVPGSVLQIRHTGRLARDPAGGPNARIRLPDLDNGVLLVFRVFERVSYGLIMDNNEPVRVGDQLVSPA